MPRALFPFNTIGRNAITSLRPYENRSEETIEHDPVAWYKMLRAYYDNNGLYDDLQGAEYYIRQWMPAMKPLRNPVHRSVEFFVAKVWPGTLPESLPIVTKNSKIIPAIQKFWTWGNWSSKKQAAIRNLAMYGDWFCKVATPESADRVYPQNILPESVTEFEEDERGFLTFCRIEVEIENEDDGLPQWHVEIWDKKKQTVRTWITRSPGAEEDTLGDVQSETNFYVEWGIEFIPIIHAQFKDVGEERGYSCVTHALDKIDELNRVSTRLHQLLFRYNKPLWAMSANMMDPTGRPLPAPKVKNSTGEAKLDLKDDSVLELPGMSTLVPMIPPIDYNASLAVVNAMMMEVERDLPELKYSSLFEKGDLSGRAVRLLMSDAIDRLIEAQGNAEAAMIRLDQMALTIGAALEIPEFANLGTYENGDFDHSFRERDPFPISAGEKADTFTKLKGGGMPFEMSMRQAGYSDDEIAQAVTQQADEQAKAEASLAKSLMQGQKTFNAGGKP